MQATFIILTIKGKFLLKDTFQFREAGTGAGVTTGENSDKDLQFNLLYLSTPFAKWLIFKTDSLIRYI